MAEEVKSDRRDHAHDHERVHGAAAAANNGQHTAAADGHPRAQSNAPAFELDRYLRERAALVERALTGAVNGSGGASAPAGRLFEAMRYSLLAGGKRLRPVLALAACEAVGGRLEAAMGFACAIEMIHTYSLIHDDLPCMDDDDLRRGRPTNHKIYGEAVATLAGDALLTDAFTVLARSGVASSAAPPAALLTTVAELAEAAGSAGMVAGQVIDLLGEGRNLTVQELEYLHRRKTGALFIAAVRGGARLGGAGGAELAALEAYARALGLAFQVIDDILDVTQTTEKLGKSAGKDIAAQKATYPALLGLDKAKKEADRLTARARAALKPFGKKAEPLAELARHMAQRTV